METCSFIDFIKILTPWLDSDYIRKGYLDKKGNFKLFFVWPKTSDVSSVTGKSDTVGFERNLFSISKFL